VESASIDAQAGTLSEHQGRARQREDGMKTNWEHQKEAITTDQKNRTEDEHLRELDKRHLKESEEEPNVIPQRSKRSHGSK
jgi:hypothetical protein